MKKCYIAIGNENSRELFRSKHDHAEESKQGEFNDQTRYVYVVMQHDNECKPEPGAACIHLRPYREELTEKMITERVSGEKAYADLAEYARKFEQEIDKFYDTDELELVFLTSSIGGFFYGTAMELIDFFVSKIACVYPKTRMTVRILTYSDEFTIDGYWDPIADRFARTKFFLDRFLEKKSAINQFDINKELYIIDMTAYSEEQLQKMIYFTSEQLEEIDMKKVCLDENALRDVDLLKIRRNSFEWKDN